MRALKAVGAAINPVFAQQSIREMGRCHRTPRNVLDDATWGAFQAGWTKPVGGDADHLEQLEDIDDTAAAGFVFYTLDPKAEVDPRPSTPTLRRSGRRSKRSTGRVWTPTWQRSPRTTSASASILSTRRSS